MLALLLILPALSVVLALAPIRRPFPLAVAGWTVALAALEVPLHVGLVVVTATTGAILLGDPHTAELVFAALVCVGLAVVVARHLSCRRVLDRAFREAHVADASTTTSPSRPRRVPWLRVLLLPWPPRPRDVNARTGLVYGPDATANRFDLYTGTGRDEVRGVLIHIHGGHFRMGRPSRESRAMLFDHAHRGWAAISTTYHLSPTPQAGFPEHLVDIKRLIRWVRLEGPEHGIPADAPIVVAGSSAGAHITMMTALTANDPRFQPGFEGVDTSVAGAIGLYGYYGRLGLETKEVSDPVRHPADAAPPVVVVHGTLDAYTPVKGSRRLVRHLRQGSPNPVVYAELPGAQHGFDAIQSPRYLAVVDALARFTDRLG